MTINQSVDLLPSAQWPQGDIRDPLGVWGARLSVAGDASGGGIEVVIRVPAGLAGAYLYTCYSAHVAQIDGVVSQPFVKLRLLTNWPDIDPAPGVTGYASLIISSFQGSGAMDVPNSGPNRQLVGPNDRFILLFDPRPSTGTIDIVGLGLSDNGVGLTWSFEAYGYFWDRSVLNAPGGPRHPGAS